MKGNLCIIQKWMVLSLVALKRAKLEKNGAVPPNGYGGLWRSEWTRVSPAGAEPDAQAGPQGRTAPPPKFEMLFIEDKKKKTQDQT